MGGNLHEGMQRAEVKANLLNASLKRLAATVGVAFGAQQVAAFAKAMVRVHGEMQNYQAAFEGLLGDAGRASELFGQLKDYALSTVFNVGDLAQAAQTMLGFNVAAEQKFAFAVPLFKENA